MKIKNHSSVVYSITAIIAFFGFFSEFVYQVFRIAGAAVNKSTNEKAFFILTAAVAVLALLSSFYFAFCSIAHNSASYDLKNLGVLHMLPMLWAGVRVAYLIYEGESPLVSKWTAVKYILLSVALFYFYFYITEIISDNYGKKAYKLFSVIFSLLSLLYFLQGLFFVVTKKAEIYDENCILALSTLLMCPYIISFKREFVIKNINSENR